MKWQLWIKQMLHSWVRPYWASLEPRGIAGWTVSIFIFSLEKTFETPNSVNCNIHISICKSKYPQKKANYSIWKLGSAISISLSTILIAILAFKNMVPSNEQATPIVFSMFFTMSFMFIFILPISDELRKYVESWHKYISWSKKKVQKKVEKFVGQRK